MADNNPVGFQLALALALIKSKPDGVPVRGEFWQLYVVE